MPQDRKPNNETPHTREPDWLAIVQSHVKSLRYGVVQIIVHDGRVTQIERTEKVRLNSAADWEI
jgi:hypothetical protein